MKTVCVKGLFLVGLLLVGTVMPSAAEDANEPGGWDSELTLGVNILQSSYSNNWNGGDKGSVVWTGNVDARAERQFTRTANWRNTLKLAYGQTHSQDRNSTGDLYWKKPDKTDDIIDFESLFRWTLASGWDPFVSVSYVSMFQDLSDLEGRELSFNPMTFKESLGISRSFITEEKRSLMTRVGVAFLQNSRAFYPESGADAETQRETSTEVAAEWVTEYKVGALDGRVDWESKLAFILPFAYSGKSVFEDEFNPVDYGLPDDVAGYTTTLDVDFTNTFTAKITKVISVKLFLRWVYDKYDNTVKPVVEDGDLINVADVHQAVRKAGQFKQTLALGFSHTF